jgi:Uma2 family endonuclease
VPEYWVVDVRNRRTFVHLQPERDEYLQRAAVPFEAALEPTRIEGLRLVIADLPRFDSLDLG